MYILVVVVAHPGAYVLYQLYHCFIQVTVWSHCTQVHPLQICIQQANGCQMVDTNITQNITCREEIDINMAVNFVVYFYVIMWLTIAHPSDQTGTFSSVYITESMAMCGVFCGASFIFIGYTVEL